LQVDEPPCRNDPEVEETGNKKSGDRQDQSQSSSSHAENNSAPSHPSCVPEIKEQKTPEDRQDPNQIRLGAPSKVEMFPRDPEIEKKGKEKETVSGPFYLEIPEAEEEETPRRETREVSPYRSPLDFRTRGKSHKTREVSPYRSPLDFRTRSESHKTREVSPYRSPLDFRTRSESHKSLSSRSRRVIDEKIDVPYRRLFDINQSRERSTTPYRRIERTQSTKSSGKYNL
jgi:hypothetical protein